MKYRYDHNELRGQNQTIFSDMLGKSLTIIEAPHRNFRRSPILKRNNLFLFARLPVVQPFAGGLNDCKN